MAVLSEVVAGGRRHRVVAEDLAPAAECLVRAHDHAGPLVAGRHQLEEQVGGLALERDVAHLVDDDERHPGEAAQLVLELAGVVSGAEAVDPLGGGGEGHAMASQAGPDAQGDRQVALAGPGRAQEHGVGLRLDEVEGVEVGDDVLADAALVLEVEVLEGLAGREASGADAGVAVGLASAHLALQAGGQELLVAPGIRSGPLGEASHAGQEDGVLELTAQVREVAGAAHAAPVAWS